MSIEFNIEDGVLVKYDGTDSVVTIPEGVEKIGERAFCGNKKVVELIMPDSVVSIEEDAFEKCIKLKTVKFSGKLERIERSAFRKCKALTEAVLPETLSYIGDSAFAGCAKLKVISCGSENIQMDSNPFDVECKLLYDKNGMLIFAGTLFDYIGEAKDVEVPYGVKRIMNYAFEESWRETSKVKSVILPETVVEVGYRAFANCQKLKNLSAPAGVTYGTAAFKGCKGLADDNGFIIIDNNALGYFGDSEIITIPDGVHTLSDELFEVSYYETNPGNKKITEVNLPTSLKKIGSQVFSGCSALVSIDIPDSVVEIGDGAFTNCANLKQINLPSSVQKLGTGLFAGCKSLADENGYVINNNTLYAYYGAERNIVIPEGIEGITHDTFNKAGIITIQLPSTLKNLGSAFQGCEMLEEIVVPEGVEVIYEHTFSGCFRLSRVVLPSTITRIGDGAFKGCEALKEIDLPKGVQYIGECAFKNCPGLENISLPNNISALEDQTFKCCSQLKTVKLPDGLKVIGPYVFSGCSNLESIEIPASISEIQYSAFQNCTSLKKVEMSDASKVTINATAFEDCPSLADENDFTIIGGILWFYSGKGGEITVPDGVTQIASNAFREGHERWKNYREEGSLRSVSLPKSLKKIHGYAFAGCIKLNEISLPENLETVGEFAFHGCKQLTSIDIPDSVTRIGKKAFAGCEVLTSVSLGAGVTEIPLCMVADCAALKSFNISKNIKAIGEDAFASCKNLSRFTVDEDNQYFSELDGILFNKDATELVFCPCGKKRTEYVVPNSVTTIATHAFIDCSALKKVVIPESVSVIGDEVFPRVGWNSNGNLKLTAIEVSPKAGAKKVGSKVFAFPFGDEPLTYPKLPVTFVKESNTQVRLGMGFCQHPEKYEGEYADIYKKYVISHEKTIVKKAKQLKLTDVEAYYSASSSVNAEAKATFKPNVSAKKLSELAKVELLEDTIQKGTVEDVKLVLDTYKSFEMMSRALGLAARYKGLAFVKELVNAGATFKYEFSPALQSKYKMNQNTAAGSYRTEYYLMLVPEKLDFKADKWGGSKYAYTPLCGVPAMNIPDALENNVLSIEERFEIAKFCSREKKLNVSLDEMLFWALTRSELKFADLLLEYGVDLNTTAPTYYTPSFPGTYMDIITSASSSIYWTEYVFRLTQLKATEVAPVLERLNKLAIAANKKLVISQKMLDEINWNDKSLAFALENMDFAKINQKKALELAVDKNFIASLEIMAQAGWLSTTARREKLNEFARTNKKKDALAWLMDFKNRTVDVQAEAAKEEAKLMKELTEDPNSVSALKKVWSYKKLDDGTLIITSYKGDAIDVEVPAVIGKAAVTVIGEGAFSAVEWNNRIKNKAERKKIKSITIPEGVVEIQKHAFWSLDELEKLILPSTIKKIGTALAGECEKLKEVNIPAGAKVVGNSVLFHCCDELHDQNGCIIIDNCLYTYTENNGRYGLKSVNGNIEIPDNVTEIAAHVFFDSGMSSLTLPNGLKVIGEKAFEKCSFLGEVTIPGSVDSIKSEAFIECSALKTVKLESGVAAIGAKAFAYCYNLRDVYIPKSVKKLGKEIFGDYDDNAIFLSKVTGICVHTQEDSPAVEYMKKYSGVYVVFDYDE